jgi:hypothetical protein
MSTMRRTVAIVLGVMAFGGSASALAVRYRVLTPATAANAAGTSATFSTVA